MKIALIFAFISTLILLAFVYTPTNVVAPEYNVYQEHKRDTSLDKKQSNIAIQHESNPSHTEVTKNLHDSSEALISNKTTAQPDDIESQKKIELAESFNAWLLQSSAENKSFNLANEMHKRFENEPIDTFWALDQENTLRNIFDRNTELAGSALKDVSCHTTQCQLLVAITDTNHANAIVEKMSAILQHSTPDLMIVSVPDEELNVVSLFVIKANSSFNFNHSD